MNNTAVAGGVAAASALALIVAPGLLFLVFGGYLARVVYETNKHRLNSEQEKKHER